MNTLKAGIINELKPKEEGSFAGVRVLEIRDQDRVRGDGAWCSELLEA
jgi:hypothetical protein